MLVLSRRAGESICIRDNIIVTVLAVHGNRVRLGIQAPAHIPVHREEVAQRIQSIGGPKGISQWPPVVETDSGLGSEERQSSNQESSF